MLSQFRVQQRLSHTGKRTTIKLGLGMSSSCQQQMDQLIKNGVARMKIQHALEREEQVRLAEDNLRRCLDRLSRLAQDEGTFPLVNEQIFDKAIKELCPFWPYC